jgi:hypothetical protein
LLQEGKSGLLWACEFNEVACVRLLWQHRHLIRFTDQRSALGLTPLMSACQQGSIECARFLVEEAGVELEAVDNCGKTALIHSASSGNLHCVQLLVSRGAAVEHADYDGDTPLIWAAWQGHASCADFLLVHGRAAIDRSDDSGLTALMNAVRWGHGGCVRLLLDHHADPTVVSRGGSTAWSLAVCADAPDAAIIEMISDAAERQSQSQRSGDGPARPLALGGDGSNNSPAQRCFSDGLQSVFDFLSLREAVSALPRVCAAWRSAWAAGAKRSRPPLHFAARSWPALISLLRSPVARHLRALATFEAEADWSLTPADAGLLSARAPALTALTAQLQLPPGEMEPSDDEDEEEAAAGADHNRDRPAPVAAPPPLEDEYGAEDEASFRFPLPLREISLRVGTAAPPAQPNPNISRLMLHLARLPQLTSLTLALPSAEARGSDGGGLRHLIALRHAPSLTELRLHANTPLGHLHLSPAHLLALTQLPRLLLTMRRIFLGVLLSLVAVIAQALMRFLWLNSGGGDANLIFCQESLWNCSKLVIGSGRRARRGTGGGLS